MDLAKGSSRGRKSNLIIQTWNRCKSIGQGGKKYSNSRISVAPEGCFSVYVGPEKQRFVVKAEMANHPLFRMLLEEAESEYGYSPKGPLALPCNVDVFSKVLLAMDDENDDEGHCVGCHHHCCVGFAKHGHGSYRQLSSFRLIAMN